MPLIAGKDLTEGQRREVLRYFQALHTHASQSRNWSAWVAGHAFHFTRTGKLKVGEGRGEFTPLLIVEEGEEA